MTTLSLQMPSFSTLKDDLLAGLSGAIAGTPQAMAFALIAGINPIYGLYTAIVSTIIGAVLGSSGLMTVGPTNALSLIVAGTLTTFDSANSIERLFILTLLSGAFHLGFGFLRLGILVKFVSNAVMTGFIAGAALLIVFGQLPYLTNYSPEGSSSLLKVVDWVRHLHLTDLYTLGVSGVAAVLILVVRNTRFKNLATLLGIVGASVLAALAGWDSVEIVRDISEIPAGLPLPTLPDFAYVPELISSALAIAILGAVQSAAIINVLPDRGGSRPNVNLDFISMGIGNMVGSLFQSMPACGSLSRTAVNIASGAQTRLANIFAGVFVALFLVLLGSLIEYVTLSALAVMLIIAAITMIDLSEIRIVWQTAISARIAMVVTFLTALIFPIEYSIYAGVIISLLLYITTSSEEVKLSQFVPLEENRFKITEIPERLPDNDVIILSVTGHLYFAAITRLEHLLPDPSQSEGSIVILRLRDSAFLATTGIHFLERYDAALRQHGGRLILTGLSSEMVEHIQHLPNNFSEMDVFIEDEILMGGTLRAYEYATEILLHK